ncbi:MAG: hypothetical protein AVO35_08180 [Candidatus Aegiribacteria sp. MLS_C]|nr:MAG: hypothetical protein AVO35_08180 [Candidatus Aegiribacteria sp. MLS_C]
MDAERLLDAARAELGNCYCPYSGFRVAAVLEDSEGVLHTGVNVENASYGLTICAERVALFKAVSGGKRSFSGLLVYSPDGDPVPCGACRQVLAEFCQGDMPVAVATDGSIRYFTVEGLIPETFRLR